MPMRILLVSAASLAALAAAPAMAQSSSYPGYGYDQGNGYARPAVPSPWQIRGMIDSAERSSEISREVARDLRDQADDLIRLERRSNGYGYDQDSRREVNRRSFRLLAELRRARNDNGYGEDYGAGDRSGRYDGGYGNGYRPTPQGGYRQPAPGYRAAPNDDDPYAAPPSDDRYGARPQDDDQRYAPDDRNQGDDNNAPPPDDGDEQPRDN